MMQRMRLLKRPATPYRLMMVGAIVCLLFFVAYSSVLAQEIEAMPSHVQESPAACANVSYEMVADAAPKSETEDELDHFVTPPREDGPVLVDLGMFIEAVTEIDPVTSTFTIEGFLDLIWCDAREAFNPDEIGWHEKFYVEDNAAEFMQLIWWPDIFFPNESGPRDTENLEVVVYEDGTIEYEERFSATLEAIYDLRLFPYDSQKLLVEIESLAWAARYMEFHQEEEIIGFRDDFHIAEWAINSVDTLIQEEQEIRDDEPFSEFVMEIDVSRQAGFYMWKVFVPMILIVILSWSVFWMEDSDLHDRLGVSFTGLLTVVAYQFIIGDALPRISYITFMDAVTTFSFVMMALTVVENVIVHMLKEGHTAERARRVDINSRLIFPLIYFIGLAVMVFAFGVM